MRSTLLRWALAACVLAGGGLGADEPPAAPAPAPPAATASEAEQVAALARAKELDASIEPLWNEARYAEAVDAAKEALALRERVRGATHVEVGEALWQVGKLLSYVGRYAEAQPFLERAVPVLEGTLGAKHPTLAEVLHELGIVRKEQGQLQKAQEAYERSLAIRVELRGEVHTDVIDTLHSLAGVHHATGALEEAVRLHRRAWAALERLTPPDEPRLARTACDLAIALHQQNKLEEARAMFERALPERERAAQEDPAGLATVLTGLGAVAYARGELATARSYWERSVQLLEGGPPPAPRELPGTLANLAYVLGDLGEFVAARRHLERALELARRDGGERHPAWPKLQAALAGTYLDEGRFEQAEALYRSALQVHATRPEVDPIERASVLDHLSVLLRRQGRIQEARELAEQGLALREKARGVEHPRVAESLRNLASLLEEQGSLAEARALAERALRIDSTAFGPDNPNVGFSLDTLARILRRLGALDLARAYAERALAIAEGAFGKENARVVSAHAALASIQRDQGQLEQATASAGRALALRERELGADHPRLVEDLILLSGMHFRRGDMQASLAVLQRAYELGLRALGEGETSVVATRANLGLVLSRLGDYAAARPHVLAALEQREADARQAFVALSPGQRRLRRRLDAERLERWVDLSELLQESAYAQVLRMKGLVGRAEAAERLLARRAAGETRPLVESLRAAQRRSAQLANEIPPAFKTEARAVWQRLYAEAGAERERLARTLAAQLAPLREHLERLELTPAGLQAVLPGDVVLVDMLRVKDRYLAWVVGRTGEPEHVTLGAAEAVEAACAAFLDALTRGGSDAPALAEVAERGRALHALVWAPVAARLGPSVRGVILCPDAALAAVPFAALPGRSEGRSLLDELAITYVLHASQVVAGGGGASLGTGAAIVGGVDYERAEEGAPTPVALDEPRLLAALDRAPQGMRFRALPGSRVEAEALAQRLGPEASTLLRGAAATEGALRASVRGKRLIHVATHGFAREDLMRGLSQIQVEGWISSEAERQLAGGHDPMVLSGLALAGANPRQGGAGDDGILTALEASYLDLEGVDLVTLSACETARGTAESGEGVLGLVSAFQLAGARHVLASLWKVDDEATRLLMEGFYERLLRPTDPLAPADALREAALALRARKDAQGRTPFAAPRYWAAFLAFGR